jgi:magnesium-transporting ATPase (P-type)
MPNNVPPETEEHPVVDPNPPESDASNNIWVQSIRSIIAAAVITVGVIFGLFGGFLSGIAPPPDPNNFPVVSFAQILTLIVVLFVYVAALNADHCSPRSFKRLMRSRMRWSIVFTVLACVLLMGYYITRAVLVFYYPPDGDKKIQCVAGLRLTELGQKGVEGFHKEHGRYPSNSELMMIAGGVAEDVWTSQSITQSRFLLLILYVFSILMTSACILSLTDVIRLNIAKHPPGGDS